jgi:hypothetical protein
MPPLYIHASEVGAAIGAAHFKSPEDVFQAIHDRMHRRPGAEVRRMADLPVARIVEAAAPDVRDRLTASVERVESIAAALAGDRLAAAEAATRDMRAAPTSVARAVVAATVARTAVEHRAREDLVTTERADIVRVALSSAACAATDPAMTVAAVDSAEARVISSVAATVAAGLTTGISAPERRPAEAVAKAVQHAVQHTVSVDRGIRAEPMIIDAVESRIGAPITQRNEEIRYMVVGGAVRIGGRADGVDESTGTIVEAKNRRRGWLGVALYELVQADVYMRLYGLGRCTLVEQLGDETREHHIAACDDRWADIERRLVAFAAAYRAWSPEVWATSDDLRRAGF